LRSSNSDDGDGDDDGDANIARRLQEKAQKLRDEIRQMESSMERRRRPENNSMEPSQSSNTNTADNNNPSSKSLKDKRILILGANGRLGSMITRYLLRTHPEVKEVVAAVHYVPPTGSSSTTRGYGRLSYEVGAEDGIGSIGPIWSNKDDEYNASFQYNPDTMSVYNLQKLRIVEVELLDPNQVRTILSENVVDAMIYCATDFEGNRPRAVASLNAAFLFRAIASPTKGRVEVEGIRNCLEGLLGEVKERRWREQQQRQSSSSSSSSSSSLGYSDDVEITETPNKISSSSSSSNPIQFVLVSTSPDAYGDFETPYGEFNGLKRQGERMVMEEFPSLSSYCVLQMGKFDDNFVQEGLELQYEEVVGMEEDTVVVDGVITAKKPILGRDDGMQKRINRRDAARAAVEALVNESLEGKKVQVYTATRKSDVW
jgi:hypothetical protein